MKKTLIALAVAASAVVSGSVIAADWEHTGTNFSIDLGGTLTPKELVTPWEVKVGDAVTNLDGQVQKGQNEVSIPVNAAIPVLGIRTQTDVPFVGRTGVNPNVNYQGAIDINQFSDGATNLTLTVNDKHSGNKIGTLTTKLSAGALYSWSKVASPSEGGSYSLGAINKNLELFYGGLSGNTAGAMSAVNVKAKAGVLFPGSMDKYNNQGFDADSIFYTDITNPNSQYSAFYFSGIEAGRVISLTLDSPVQGDTPIDWKASLPITVSYQ
ncbi:TPA: hypothetical protein ACYUXQ_004139 [Escherichia coli]